MRYRTNVFEFYRHTDGKWYKRWTKHCMEADTLEDAKVQCYQYMAAMQYPEEHEYTAGYGRYVVQSETVNHASNLYFWIMDTYLMPV